MRRTVSGFGGWNREAAIEIWKSIPFGTVEIATENLNDIQKPIGEQNGPWFFENEHWLPKRLFTMLRQERPWAKIDKQMDEEEQEVLFERHVKPLFKKAFSIWPSLERTLIEMLKRGGPESRDWVRLLLGYCSTPELRTAVLDFVSGQSGADACRHEYLGTISQLQWLQSGETFQLWKNGKASELQLRGTEIYWETQEAIPPLSPASGQKVEEAKEAVRSGNWEKGIELLNEVNMKEPGRPSIIYNIASYRLALGYKDGYDETIDRLVRDFPDYFFAKTALTKRLIEQGRLDEAWDILKPLHELTRMHGSEYKALAGTTIMYHLAKGEMDVAQSLHKSAVEICGKRFPSLEQYHKELKRKPLIPTGQSSDGNENRPAIPSSADHPVPATP